MVTLTREIEVEGERITISKLAFGPYVELAEDESKAGTDFVARAQVTEKWLEAAASPRGLTKRLSVAGVTRVYAEIVRFSLEDLPQDEQGKAPSP